MSFPQPPNFTARATVVNRTHRVVRQRAENMRELRERSRSSRMFSARWRTTRCVRFTTVARAVKFGG